jgi:hypothetical protein
MSLKGKKLPHEDTGGDESDDDKEMPAVKPIKISDFVAKPKKGVRVDVRDHDNLWSPGRVVEIAHDKSGVMSATIRFDGWEPTYDESFPWNSDRLAPQFSFCKQVKCLVDLLPKPRAKPTKAQLESLAPGAKRSYCTLWPCKLQLRMPHPFEPDDLESLLYAEQYLLGEGRIFIQPYAPELLPNVAFDASKFDGGRWLPVKKVRSWTDDPSQLGIMPKNFEKAFEIAKEDDSIVGTLPVSAFQEGSLLKAVYRVHSLAGAEPRDGALREASEIPKHWQDHSLQPIMVDPSELEKQQDPSSAKAVTRAEEIEINHEATIQAEVNTPFVPAPPPALPPAIPITDSVYEGCGVRRCKVSHQWTASVCLGGNELFLGSFPTQTQAYQATRIAVDKGTEIEANIAEARLEDLRSVPIEAVIEAREQKYDTNVHEFSIHEYALQQIRYEAGLVRLGVLSIPAQQKEASRPRKKKRKGTPRKVDLDNHCYID